jgi:hypothetical protein
MKERSLCCFTRSVEPFDYYESSSFWHGEIVDFIVGRRWNAILAINGMVTGF